ncbi:MAG: GIY-YIG nuclease family protein [Rhodospirillales bacterium]|nr:GIY-YIG nuclease family protein [Rhodospirillales bacterium]
MKQRLGDKGAYLLIVRLERSVTIGAGRMRGARLPPGLYAYAGSAWGPGGIEARLARHRRPDKRIHWHIDHLTNRAASIASLAFAGEPECKLMDRLLALKGVTIPAPGFGASDCRHCPAHLVRLPDSFRLSRAAAGLRRPA